MNIEIRVIKLGKLFLAVTVLGGITIRGQSASETGDAVRNLLWKLAGRDGEDDARVAVELALEGTDLSAEMERPQLGDGVRS